MVLYSPLSINYDVSLHLSFLAVIGIIYTQDFFKRFCIFLPKIFAIQEAFVAIVSDMMEHGDDEFHVSWYGLFMQVSAYMVRFDCLEDIYISFLHLTWISPLFEMTVRCLHWELYT